MICIKSLHEYNIYFCLGNRKKGLDETLQVVIGMLLVPVHRYAMGCG